MDSDQSDSPGMYFVLQQSADGDAQTLTEVDLFISTQRIKVLNADSQVSLLLSAEGLKALYRDQTSSFTVAADISDSTQLL